MRDVGTTQAELLRYAQLPALASRRDALVELGRALSSDDAHHWARVDLFSVFGTDAVEDPASAKTGARATTTEIVRNVFILVPLLVTWIGISLAVRGYGELTEADPRAASKPFVQLWQDGFSGRSPTFALIGLIDVIAIVIVIGLSLYLGFLRREVEVTIPAREGELWNELQGCLVDATLHLARAAFDSPVRFNEELTKAVTQMERIGAQVRSAAVEVGLTLTQTHSALHGLGAGTEALTTSTTSFATSASTFGDQIHTLTTDLTRIGAQLDHVIAEVERGTTVQADATGRLDQGLKSSASALAGLTAASRELVGELGRQTGASNEFLTSLAGERESQESANAALRESAQALGASSAAVANIVRRLDESSGTVGRAGDQVQRAAHEVDAKVQAIEHAFGASVDSLPGRIDHLVTELRSATATMSAESLSSRQALVAQGTAVATEISAAAAALSQASTAVEQALGLKPRRRSWLRRRRQQR